MSVFFDCRFIRVDHHDGISRFSSELFKSLSMTESVTAIISDIQQLNELPQGADYFLANDPKNPLLELFLPRRLNKQGASVVFSPMQTMGSLGKKYRLILTLHDLIYYKHRKPPVFLAWPIRLAWRLFHLSFAPVRFLLNGADAVVTISETTKSLIEMNRLTRRPVTVFTTLRASLSLTRLRQSPRRRILSTWAVSCPIKMSSYSSKVWKIFLSSHLLFAARSIQSVESNSLPVLVKKLALESYL